MHLNACSLHIQYCHDWTHCSLVLFTVGYRGLLTDVGINQYMLAGVMIIACFMSSYLFYVDITLIAY